MCLTVMMENKNLFNRRNAFHEVDSLFVIYFLNGKKMWVRVSGATIMLALHLSNEDQRVCF